MTGLQKIGKQTLYFDQDGKQVKGKVVTLADKSIRYFDANSGEMAVGKFAEGAKNEWYYFDQTGKAVTGLQKIGKHKREVGGSSPLVPINRRITQEAEEDGLLNLVQLLKSLYIHPGLLIILANFSINCTSHLDCHDIHSTFVYS
ncbi:hypothetical protein V470_11045 [Streptococcus sp. VT 162]|nr:hypothetical protein V470_11045 [Streptococcus sp. VT 162]